MKEGKDDGVGESKAPSAHPAKRRLGSDMHSHKEPMNGAADGNIGSGASSGFA